MPHLELSVSGPHVARVRTPAPSPLDRWATAVRDAGQLCVVVDTEAVIVAISAPFERLLGLRRPAVGRELVAPDQDPAQGVLQLVDFADGGKLADAEVGKIPPLLALTSRQLARGLLRVRTADSDCTLDAVATPLLDADAVAGSLTFFTSV